MATNPLDYSSDRAKVEACIRLERDFEAAIGEGDKQLVHVEIMPRWKPNATGGADFTQVISDSDIAQIVKDVNTLGNVGTLDLSENQITDQAASHLAGLRGITSLYLSGTRFTDTGVAHLVAITSLRDLVLSGTDLTDVGLTTLADAKGLRFLQLFETQVTDAGVARLKQALPELRCER